MVEDTGCTDRRATRRTHPYVEEAGGSTAFRFGPIHIRSRNVRLFWGYSTVTHTGLDQAMCPSTWVTFAR